MSRSASRIFSLHRENRGGYCFREILPVENAAMRGGMTNAVVMVMVMVQWERLDDRGYTREPVSRILTDAPAMPKEDPVDFKGPLLLGEG